MASRIGADRRGVYRARVCIELRFAFDFVRRHEAIVSNRAANTAKRAKLWRLGGQLMHTFDGNRAALTTFVETMDLFSFTSPTRVVVDARFVE